MQVRRFEATTMKDALTAVKRELGNNAVILTTKEVPSTDGIRLYEVTAASAVQSKAGAESASSSSNSMDSTYTPELISRIAELNELMPTRAQMRMVEGAVKDVKNLIIEALRQRDVETHGHSHLFAINQTLKAAGIDEASIAELNRHMSSLPPPSEINKSIDEVEGYYRDQAMRWMLKRIRISPKWNATPGITSVHVFVGTPGSGKTSLISKVAAEIHKRDRHKVAILSFNTSKVAASEQTRVFAKILGIQHQEFSEAHELKKLVVALKGVDIVLVDAPGTNPMDSDSTKSFEIMKNLGLSLDFHLVVSAAEKFSVSEKAISNFSSLGLSSLAIAKLDECSAYGEAYTYSSRWSLPLSYLTYGSDFSTGIERATRERILERIFNL
ncbi:MAG: hypothetical protein NT027_07260 [Proteobacteria bacterium]|nr:hypothetical protein [Pseudomonadota bacterium]